MRAAAIVVALALGAAGCATVEQPAPVSREATTAVHVDGAQAQQLVRDGALLLDVRTPEEYAAGHIEGAVNIHVEDLAARAGEVPDDRAVVVYCGTGRRSARAASILVESGHKKVYDLGAMENW